MAALHSFQFSSILIAIFFFIILILIWFCSKLHGFIRACITVQIMRRYRKFCQGGGSTFDSFMREKRVQIPLKQGHHRPASETSFKSRWWPNIECCLGSFVIFQGIRTSIAKEPYIFVITCPPLPLDPHMQIHLLPMLLSPLKILIYPEFRFIPEISMHDYQEQPPLKYFNANSHIPLPTRLNAGKISHIATSVRQALLIRDSHTCKISC